ncbi:MAG: DJ-1/PfpI family protein [Planctomycetes bacterium]|nr:DJ-1/PfpI family protein [Planctomycetota bacterium]
MAKKDAKPQTAVDADGLAVQQYRSLVLVVVPPSEFGEQALRYARSSLYNVHVGTRSVSTQMSELIKGAYQDEFMVDDLLANASMDGYSGLILVGGAGALALADDADVQRLARDAMAKGKLVAAWGHSVALLAKAGVLKGRRVCANAAVREVLERAGAKCSTRQVEVDGNLVTGLDDSAGMRFGKALAERVGI